MVIHNKVRLFNLIEIHLHGNITVYIGTSSFYCYLPFSLRCETTSNIMCFTTTEIDNRILMNGYKYAGKNENVDSYVFIDLQ